MATTETVRLSQETPVMSPKNGANPFEVRLTGEQADYLERQFGKTKNPHPSELILIAAETGLQDEEVKVWFDHRMAMWRRDQGLSPFRSRLC